MRISDWSSDVCSSDLCMTESKAGTVELEARSLTEARPSAAMPVVESVRPIIWERTHLRLLDQRLLPAEVRYLDCRGDRKSVGEGKSVSVRVDLGGRRIIKKKKRTRHNY